ncbi:uncharacterized protein BEWA_041750 [Theileria equi strain WA]|uniref:Membrane protein, putative n=1 Tax=Theileria equi strain WA TaxID=1537102 RepID=L1LFC5_THEEQ|nr:uncharacterized protein BEWA_041750 [Theileria equi strain WA]EKX74137.1 membrane protein, putative [Theileria equi strain WA]|eukprot:XP_004833589.1 uncharacterized protein BEWA_041750 [Theileria equi strain WA]
MALGTSVHNKIIGCVVGGIIGLPVGIIIGLVPIFKALEANQRYSQSEVIGSFEESGIYAKRHSQDSKV